MYFYAVIYNITLCFIFIWSRHRAHMLGDLDRRIFCNVSIKSLRHCLTISLTNLTSEQPDQWSPSLDIRWIDPLIGTLDTYMSHEDITPRLSNNNHSTLLWPRVRWCVPIMSRVTCHEVTQLHCVTTSHQSLARPTADLLSIHHHITLRTRPHQLKTIIG